MRILVPIFFLVMRSLAWALLCVLCLVAGVAFGAIFAAAGIALVCGLVAWAVGRRL